MFVARRAQVSTRKLTRNRSGFRVGTPIERRSVLVWPPSRVNRYGESVARTYQPSVVLFLVCCKLLGVVLLRYAIAIGLLGASYLLRPFRPDLLALNFFDRRGLYRFAPV